MTTMIHVNRNEGGIINTGSNTNNEVINIKKEYSKTEEIKWDVLNSEINKLKSNRDASIKKFAHEAENAAHKKDKKEIFNVLSKWIPCISDLISSSYYIMELAKGFNIIQ